MWRERKKFSSTKHKIVLKKRNNFDLNLNKRLSNIIYLVGLISRLKKENFEP